MVKTRSEKLLCEYCQGPDSDARGRYKCRSKGCPVPPQDAGRRPDPKMGKKVLQAKRNARYRATENGAEMTAKAAKAALERARKARGRQPCKPFRVSAAERSTLGDATSVGAAEEAPYVRPRGEEALIFTQQETPCEQLESILKEEEDAQAGNPLFVPPCPRCYH